MGLAAKGAATIEIECYRRMQKRELRELEAEGLAFLGFMRPEAKSRDVRVKAMS